MSAPAYHAGNKAEAERCVDLARLAWNGGDLSRAQRLLTKSLQLYPTAAAQTLIAQLAREVAQQRQAAEGAAGQQRASGPQAQQRRHSTFHPPPSGSGAGHARTPSSPHFTQRPRGASFSATSPSTPHGSPRPTSSPASPPPNAGYTAEQQAAARNIIKLRKDYYAMFSVSRSATEQEIKSSYRKLALKFHPDKNKAPEAEEAFKAVSAAFQCLSDPKKRAHYDAYGDDAEQGGVRARQAAYAQQQQQHWARAEDLTPEEIFQMFFSGGMGMGAQPRRSYTYRPRQRSTGQTHANSQDSFSSLFGQFAHFLPLLMLLLFGLLSAPSAEESVFGLERSASFPLARQTAHAKIDYWVSNQFDYRYRRDVRALAQIEAMVEQQAFKRAEEDCSRQKRVLMEDERRAKRDLRGAELAAKLQALQARKLEGCERLARYQANAHGASRGG